MELAKRLYLNGIDGESGDYAHAPRSPEAMVSLLADFEAPVVPRPTIFGVESKDLAQAGWAVLWPQETSSQQHEALNPLIELRRRQAQGRFRELEVHPGETPLEFLERHGAGPGPVDPSVMPYHLLLAAGPETIPFSFQNELAISHSVGRLDLGDLESAASYTERLVQFEKRAIESPRHAAFFGVEHRDDPLTWLSSEHLVAELDRRVARRHRGWDIATILRRAATKQALRQVLTSCISRPSLLFTASHGLFYTHDCPRQATHQGAILCADYPGPKAWQGPIVDRQTFSALDVARDLDLSGMLICNFGCYSAGTPKLDLYEVHKPEVLADQPFVAPLAQAFLRQGALGVIGHVDVTFEQSFLWYRAGAQVSHFESLLAALLAGEPLGAAMDYLAMRHAQLAATVAAEVRRAQRSQSSEETARHLSTWASYEDARNFVLLGDPAARLHVSTS